MDGGIKNFLTVLMSWYNMTFYESRQHSMSIEPTDLDQLVPPPLSGRARLLISTAVLATAALATVLATSTVFALQ